MDYGGHDSIFEDNMVVTYPNRNSQNCVGFGSFSPGHGHTVRRNKCIIPHSDRPSIAVDHCNGTNADLHDNEYYSPNGTILVHCYDSDTTHTLAEAVDWFGMETGSIASETPDESDIVTWSKAILW